MKRIFVSFARRELSLLPNIKSSKFFWLVFKVISIVETKSNLMVTPSMFQEGSRRVGVDVREEYERPR